MPEGRKTILAVDDVSMNLAIIKNLLSGDFDVRVAKSAEIAMFILGSVKVDLILLDIEMPGMSGFEFVEAMKNMPEIKGTPVIFVTAHASPEIMAKADETGVLDYIVKPINVNILKEKVFSAFNMEIPS